MFEHENEKSPKRSFAIYNDRVCVFMHAFWPLPVDSEVLWLCSLLAAELTYIGSEDFLSCSSWWQRAARSIKIHILHTACCIELQVVANVCWCTVYIYRQVNKREGTQSSKCISPLIHFYILQKFDLQEYHN